MPLVYLIADSCTIEIPESSLSMDCGKMLVSRKRVITQLPGLEWFVEYYPNGYYESEAGHVSVFLNVTKYVDVRYILSVKNTDIKKQSSIGFAIEGGELNVGYSPLVSHEDLRKSGAIQDGKVSIVWDVEFENPVGGIFPLPINELFLPSAPKVTFVIGDETVKVNKAILTNVSPVFNAMFSHDTKEAKTGVVVIEDFDKKTVQNIMDFCTGVQQTGFTTKECIEMLKFADKYDITNLIKHLESMFIDNVSDENLCDVANYAWTYSRVTLQEECASCIVHYYETAILTSDFVNLEPTVMASLLKAAFEIKKRIDKFL